MTEREDFTFIPEEEELVMEENTDVAAEIQVGITTARLRIRKEPKGEIVYIAEKGELIEFSEIEDGWAHLLDGNYCMAKFLDI